MEKKKVIVSACLLGEYCRYDGTTKADRRIIDLLKEAEVIPFCPEAPVMGTPRGRISVFSTDTGLRVLRNADRVDVTEPLLEQTLRLIDAHPDAEAIILKSKSPSCGLGTVPILDEAGNEIGRGNGIAADILLRAFDGIEIADENNFSG